MAVKFTKPEINVREKLAELDKPSGIAGEAMLRAETPQEQQALIGISGRRNFIMNGRGFIDQRGKSGASLGAGEFGLDRWSNSTAGTTMTQLSGGGFRGARTSANTWSRLSHRVEDCYNAIGTNELTISFDIKWNTHSGNGNSMVYLRWLQDNGTETGTATDLDISKTGLSGKEKFTKTFTMPSDATNPKHLMILFYGARSTGSAWDFELDNIQLELGKVATPFEHRSFGEELALCQRYCYVIGHPSQVIYLGTGSMYTTTAVNLSVPLPVQLRHNSPSFTRVANGTGNWLNVYVGATGTLSNAAPLQGDYTQSNMRIYIPGAHSGSSPSAVGAGVWSMVLAGAQLIINAEL
jgi:hypothetical protein